MKDDGAAERWADAEFPGKLLDLLDPPARYKIGYGGRGGAKSWAFARMLLIKGAEKPLRILCARETQKSIADSVHHLLETQIRALGLVGRYQVLKSTIIGSNGTVFIFSGLRNNVDNIKSLEDVDIVWVEEAHKVSKESWDKLIPTIRKAGSEIWVSFNPDFSSDNTYVRFVSKTPPGARRAFVSYRDNPWFPAELELERQYCKQLDPDGYLNIWEGQPRATVSGAVYAEEIRRAEAEGRITDVPYDAQHPVHTFWDLGYGDRVSMWFAQIVGVQWRIIDYYANTRKPIDFYLQEMQRRHYTYGTCVLPWDGDTPELGTGVSIAGQIRSKGFKAAAVRKSMVHIGINAVRTIFGQLWFDVDKCTFPPCGFLDAMPGDDQEQWRDYWGITGLRRYQWGEIPKSGKEQREPLHDLASHPADALRTLAMWMRNPTKPASREEPMIYTSAWN
jgi:phage terminase large subunit